MPEVRSTAEALRAISDELRAIERARLRDGEPLPATFPAARPWTIAASSFAFGFAVARFVRASIARRSERRVLPDATVTPPLSLDAPAGDRTFAFALDSMPEAQLGS